MSQKQNYGCLIAVVMVILIVGLIGVNVYLVVRMISEATKTAPASHSPGPPTATDPAAPKPAPVDIVTSKDGAFTRDRSLQASGYYKPQDTLPVGVFNLVDLKLGPVADFTSAETNGLGPDSEAPFVLVFARAAPAPAVVTPDTPMPKAFQVVCRRYVLTREAVSCEADDPQFGKVSFHGKFAPDFAAKIAVIGDSTAFFDEGAITGELTVGKTVVKDVSLAYWKDE